MKCWGRGITWNGLTVCKVLCNFGEIKCKRVHPIASRTKSYYITKYQHKRQIASQTSQIPMFSWPKLRKHKM